MVKIECGNQYESVKWLPSSLTRRCDGVLTLTPLFFPRKILLLSFLPPFFIYLRFHHHSASLCILLIICFVNYLTLYLLALSFVFYYVDCLWHYVQLWIASAISFTCLEGSFIIPSLSLFIKSIIASLALNLSLQDPLCSSIALLHLLHRIIIPRPLCWSIVLLHLLHPLRYQHDQA